MMSRALGMRMAGRRVGRKLKCPCTMGKLEAGSSLKSHGKLAAEAGRGGYELWPQVSPFPPRRGVSHWQEEVCEPPDDQAPPPAVGAKWDSRNWQAGSDRSLAILGEREREGERGEEDRREEREKRRFRREGRGRQAWMGPHRALGAMVRLPTVEEGQVFDEDGGGPQDEGYEEVHMDVVPCAVELPVGGGQIWEAEEGLRPPPHPTRPAL